jgi:hypothetical protein
LFVALLISIPSLHTASSLAQRPEPSPAPAVKGDGRGGSPSAAPGARKVSPDPIALIQMIPVQQELKLTEVQKAKIIKTRDEFNRRQHESLPRLATGAAVVDREAFLAQIGAVRAEYLAALTRILEPSQRTRLEQIALQVEGPLALAKPEVASRINVTPEQADQIQWIVAQMSASRDQLMQERLTQYENNAGTGGGAPGAGAKARSPKAGVSYEKELETLLDRIDQNSTALQKNAIREISRVLSRRQKAAFNKLLGAPFDTSVLEPGRGKRAGALPPSDAPTQLTPITPDGSPAQTQTP